MSNNIHASENCSDGLRLVMTNGEIWFHPNDGGKPEKRGLSSHYRDSLKLCRERGQDHRAYGWSPRPERDWSTAQRAAYDSAWEN